MSENFSFIFPGQGSQKQKMGFDIFENYTIAKNIFKKADELFGQKLSDYCFYADDKILQKTEIAQPALFTISFAIYEILKSKGITPSYLAGHSLGEYTALACGDVLSFEDAFNLVKVRGELMAKASEKIAGTMAVVTGFDRFELEKCCKEFCNDNSVVIANYNGSQRIVVSGKLSAMEEFSQFIKNKGKKIIPLNVSGAFHSPLMESALDDLIKVIDSTKFNDTKIPIITNIDAKITTNSNEFKEKLKKQLISPVFWEDSILFMITLGINNFIEIGTNNVLTKTIKNIDKNMFAQNIEDSKSLNDFLNRMETNI